MVFEWLDAEIDFAVDVLPEGAHNDRVHLLVVPAEHSSVWTKVVHDADCEVSGL